MKIRTGFVSNSSSSSFCIIFEKDVKINDLIKQVKNKDEQSVLKYFISAAQKETTTLNSKEFNVYFGEYYSESLDEVLGYDGDCKSFDEEDPKCFDSDCKKCDKYIDIDNIHANAAKSLKAVAVQENKEMFIKIGDY